MSEKEILEAITEREYLDAEMRMFRTHFSPEKLAAFLAKHLSPTD